MNKRSILTAVLALGLGVTALTGCSDNTGANYVTPSNVETIQNSIAEIGDQGVKVPEKRDLKVTLPESDKAADYKVEVSDPETLSVGKPEKNVITLHPLKVTGEDADPVTVTVTDKDASSCSTSVKQSATYPSNVCTVSSSTETSTFPLHSCGNSCGATAPSSGAPAPAGSTAGRNPAPGPMDWPACNSMSSQRKGTCP